MKKFKKVILLSAISMMAMSARSEGTYSLNAVGYINVPIYTGDNLIANQLSDSPDNTLDTIFSGGGILSGSTFTEWNTLTDQLMPASTFNGTTWSINYTLGPNGIGGVLNSPGNTGVTLVGEVVNVNLASDPPQYTFTPPALAPGTYLLALAAPFSGVGFQQVVGSAPIAGDSVQTLDAATQTYTTTTFNGTLWDNGAPALGLDQSAYFTLVNPVPEPSTLGMTVAGLTVLISSARCRIPKVR